MRLIEIPFDEADTGDMYLTKIKDGWIYGEWDAEDKVCRGYYGRDMEWYPQKLYKIVNADADNDRLKKDIKTVGYNNHKLFEENNRLKEEVKLLESKLREIRQLTNEVPS